MTNRWYGLRAPISLGLIAALFFGWQAAETHSAVLLYAMAVCIAVAGTGVGVGLFGKSQR